MRSKNPDYFERIIRYIDDYTEKNNRSPSNREMAKGTGLSTATVSRYLSQMREDGLLDYSGQRNITTKSQAKHRANTLSVPVLGSVSCGILKYAEENIEEYIELPISLFGQGDFFILRANGDSMIEAGIDDGNLVLIRHQDTAEPGQIVVALMEDEATLKRFYPEPELHRVRLHPENSEMNDIYVDHCVVQGVAVKVIKDVA